MKRIIKSILVSFPYLLQKYTLRFILGINLQKHEGHYKVTKNGDELYFLHKSRITRYLTGIDSIGKNLSYQYMLDTIDFAEDDVFIDVGANIGELSKHILNKHTNIRLIAFEPAPLEYKVLIKNVQNFNAKLYNVGLWNTPGELDFYIKSESADNSIFEMKEYDSIVTIKLSKLDTMLHNLEKIKVLKIEAEGAEPEILQGAIKTLKKTEYVTLDGGPERGITQSTTIEECINILVNNDFRLLRINMRRGTALFKRLF